jgi:hypothetical protein
MAAFIKMFGDPDSPSNIAIRTRAEALAEGRSANDAMTVNFIDAESMHVWDHAA